MRQRLIVVVEEETVELDLDAQAHMDPVREMIASMVKRNLSFDQYSNEVNVVVRCYPREE